MNPPVIRLGLASASLLVSAGCAMVSPTADRLLGVITPYRIDITQGNVVTREMAAQVKPGMSRAQVREILGSPLVTSAFHGERWDYVFTLRRQGVEPQRRSIVAHFKGDTLERLDAPDLPSEQEFVASIRRTTTSGPEPVLALTDAQKKALPPPVKSESASGNQPLGAARTYPPLEAQ
jgi:outer membrane protein assembly factor BamE